MQELRGITGDHLMQPPGFNLSGSKSGAPKRLSGSPKDKQPESGRTRTGSRSGSSRWKHFSTNLYSCPWNECNAMKLANSIKLNVCFEKSQE